MLVLKIVGVLVFALLFYLLITWLNALTLRKYNYEFITPPIAFLYACIYALLYFGRGYYLDAVIKDGDIWNGILLFSFGVIVFIIRFIKNIKIAGFFKGILYTIAQLIIYLPIAIFGFIARFL